MLVTDWNPLEVWFYDECYVRFAAEDYEEKQWSKFSHLTNNSIAKYSKHFDTSEIEGNMWTCTQLGEFFKDITGENIFLTKIQPRLKQIVTWSLECVQDMVEQRKNTCELYGYDFMIDSNFTPWLIEINSSPAMDYSSPVTERLVKLVLQDCAKVLIDWNFAKKKDRPNVDTGLFKMIHRSSVTMEKQVNTVGLNLFCEGKSIKKNKTSNFVKPKQFEMDFPVGGAFGSGAKKT